MSAPYTTGPLRPTVVATDTASLRVVASDTFTDGCEAIVFNGGTLSRFSWDWSLSYADDGSNYIKPADVSGNGRWRLDNNIGGDVNPSDSTLVLRDSGGQVRATSFAPDVPANVAGSGLLRSPGGSGGDQTIVAARGASNPTVALLSFVGTGTRLQMGDGVEVETVEILGGANSVALDSTGLATPNLIIGGVTAPSSPGSGKVALYVDAADGRLKAKFPNGSISYLGMKMQQRTSKTLVANNTTANVPIFGVTGAVRFTKLYGIVTTVLGSNVTAAQFMLNDQAARAAMSGSALLSSKPAGTLVAMYGSTGGPLTLSSATGVYVLPAGRDSFIDYEFTVVQKTGNVTTSIEFQYTTTNAPTSGAIQFFCEYEPLSADGAVAAL